MKEHTGILVIGSGIAGLFFAIQASRFSTVTIVTKKARSDSNTNFAQGGIACVSSQDDSFDAHLADTLAAGAGLCRRDIAEMVIKEGPARIEELLGLGMRFSACGPGVFELGREGGHSCRRILHAGDHTGREIEQTLLDRIRENGNIKVLENHIAIDLIIQSKAVRRSETHDRCLGAFVLDELTGEVLTVTANATVLATGGAGQVYLHTTNPEIATGDGVAMAYRAGARISNMEFFQFHPTALYRPGSTGQSFLISEAVRGEGAVLRLHDGTPFMERYHDQKELAPRDIVARAIDREMKSGGLDCVYLDITHRPTDFLRQRFPQIFDHCASIGIDIGRDWIPVVPSAHYLCGGVLTDRHGESSLSGLFAIGEVACTGFHGANRLASNSLLEALVFAHNACERCRDIVGASPPSIEHVRQWQSFDTFDEAEQVVIRHNWQEIKALMWNYVGIVRTDKRLERARRRISLLREEIREYYMDFRLAPQVIELRNILTVADLIVQCATMRKESRGLHFNLDYPDPDDGVWLKNTVLVRKPGGYV